MVSVGAERDSVVVSVLRREWVEVPTKDAVSLPVMVTDWDSVGGGWTVSVTVSVLVTRSVLVGVMGWDLVDGWVRVSVCVVVEVGGGVVEGVVVRVPTVLEVDEVAVIVVEFLACETESDCERVAVTVCAHAKPVTFFGHRHGHAEGVRVLFLYVTPVPLFVVAIVAPVLLLQSSNTLHRCRTHITFSKMVLGLRTADSFTVGFSFELPLMMGWTPLLSAPTTGS
jgi:hypothetical protein